MNAAQRWADELAAWRIDPAILDAAPESPYGFPAELFRVGDEPPEDSPSRRRALEVLPAGGTVLDVGCGGGAAGLALVPPAGRVVGVDESETLLAEFVAAARARGVGHEAVLGRWPDVAGAVGTADVAVSHHVAYNVPDLAAFALALQAHARRRVVLELTARHPWVPLGEMWRHFHGQDRPQGPTVELAAEVLREAGLAVEVERAPRRAPRPRDRAALVAFTRRRLCLPASRDPEVDALLGPQPALRVEEVATIWWAPPTVDA